MAYVLLIYYATVNIMLFFLMGIDKSKAKKHKWRISESALLTLSIAGGAVGGFAGMYLFRHKTKKFYFHIIFSIALLLHIYIVAKILIQQ